MNKVRIYPYKLYSNSARKLKQELRQMGIDCLIVKPVGNYWPKPNHLVVNWGSSAKPNWKNPLNKPFTLINNWINVPNSIDKIRAFARMKACGVSVPEVAVAEDKAKEWLAQGKCVIGRTTVIGKGGKGIVIMAKPEDFIKCPLYSVYKPKKKEFRVHVFKGNVIDIQEKKKKQGFKDVNSKIRSHDNGWVFCRQGVICPQTVQDQSVAAVKALGLDFGGVDCIYNEKEQKAYVLEVNSAPGIEGTTVKKYAEAIRNCLQ